MRGLALSLIVLAAVGCGGGSSPSAPSPSVPTPSPAASTAPAPSPTPEPSPTPPAGPTVLRSTSLRGANGHAASGTARVLREGGAFRLELGADFRIDSGHNDVYLTAEPDAARSTDLNLGNMQSLTGRQTYTMPDDGGRFRYVMLWCRPFRVPIGLGELQ